ncbi:hypothetical protein [Deinococcus sp. NW-56]|uniref:hypothetical protein n=1 Tax=Deinococcus sp. NW-56 TaxID=2080419 RepID=UPI000CF4C6EA|nr:hypothetical protein [Deinococcus sp. NW-56]
MTLDHWLREATAGLPPEVVERVRAEYAAHVADSGLPEAEAVAALGQPEGVRRALGQTYLGAERLETLREESLARGLFGLVWLLPLLYGGYMVWDWWSWERGEGVTLPWGAAGPALATLLNLLVWRVTARTVPERRRLWRTQWGSLCVISMLWINDVVDVWRGQEAEVWGVGLLGTALLAALAVAFRDDRRLRRTLALKESRP